MIGKLDPEENVMSEKTYYGARKSRQILYNQGVLDQVATSIESLKWDCYDDVTVEIGGGSISGIDVGEDYNQKWQSPIGTRKYNKDSFIIIKNQDRRDPTKSKPFQEGEFKPHHEYETD